jgi:hypothetical protein
MSTVFADAFYFVARLNRQDQQSGEDAVKSAGQKYLPRLDSQTDEEFLAYRNRAAFFNATARSAEGFVGLIFRRAPFVKVPEVHHNRQRLSRILRVNEREAILTLAAQGWAI